MSQIKYSAILVGVILIVMCSNNAYPQQDLARNTYKIFEQHCFNCHGQDGAYKETLLIEYNTLIEDGLVVPGNPNDSELYKRLIGSSENGARMPLGQPQLSSEFIETIQNWILAGALDWARQTPTSNRFISHSEMFDSVEKHLISLSSLERNYARYLTLTHLYNAREESTEDILKEHRDSLSKLINSLSWERDIAIPKPIDPEKTILYIDIRHYEWDRNDGWSSIEEIYPYNISFDNPNKTDLKAQLNRLQTEMNSDIPSIRADWFISAASKPPLYHELLSLPLTDKELESRLDVDVVENIRNAPGIRVIRAGFNNSGVSENNRVVERHKSRYGAYWKSYDFAGNIGIQNIFTNPLDFAHDGGEVIFNLPNGLQGYYIVNASGIRLDEAPINIVSDPAASDPIVRTGISCFGCHVEGMNSFNDQVREVVESDDIPSYNKEHTLQIYVEQSRLDEAVNRDVERYRHALEETGNVFGVVEPISRSYKKFNGPIYASTAAAEVGLETEAFLKVIRENAGLQNLGLLAIDSEGGSVKRDAWETNFGDILLALDFPTVVSETDTETDTDVLPESIVRVKIPDKGLRLVIEETLGTEVITQSSIATLKTLRASNRGISNLKGLEFALNLEELWISENPITNLSPLAGCVNLIGLGAWHVPISDLSPLAELTKLEWLECVEGSISDISPIENLKNLKRLVLYTQKISDISPLRNLKNLRSIRLTHNRISEISSLSALANLEEIAIYDNQISDISPLSGLIRLKVLRISDNRISNISPLRKLTNLTVLELGRNSVRDITPLKELRNLKTLSLSRTGISDLSSLKELRNLKTLSLSHTDISDISSLKGLFNLEDLDLSHNKISNVSPLSGLINLERLNLSHNLIASITSLEPLSKRAIILWSNNPGSPRGGPKIEGPWLWTWIPGAHHHGDMLAEVTGGAVTEPQIATHGATEGEPAGNSVWTSHKLSPSGNNNIRELTNALGWAPGRELYDIVLYGCINLYSPREQETNMYLGCDDGARIWLNGTKIFHKSRTDGSLSDYNTHFPVTLKQGKNILFVILDDRNYQLWSAFFGFDTGAEYALAPPSVGYTLSKTPIHVGDIFTINIRAEDVFDLGGWQFDIAFDPAMLEAIDVREGDFLKPGGATTFFQSGPIDNANGKITGLITLQADRTVSGSGPLLQVRFKAKASGETELALQNFQFGNVAGKDIPVDLPDISIIIEGRLATGDVNRDGVVSILDLILVARQLGNRVPPDSPVDVNGDGVVDIFDITLTAQGLGDTTARAAPAAATESIDPALIEAWITQARLEDDGSIAFRQGIENLQNLLISLIPQETMLHPNYPNPFNPETWIPYQLAESAKVTLRIYDVNGQMVRRLEVGYQPPGKYQSRSRAVYWDGRNQRGESVASGLYFYTLTAGEFTATRRMLIGK